MLPISRLATEVHYGDDFDSIVPHSVDEAEGEFRNATLAPSSRKHGKVIRMGLDPADGVRDGLKESPAQAGLLGFVVSDGPQELRSRLRMKPMVHPFRPSAASLRT